MQALESTGRGDQRVSGLGALTGNPCWGWDEDSWCCSVLELGQSVSGGFPVWCCPSPPDAGTVMEAVGTQCLLSNYWGKQRGVSKLAALQPSCANCLAEIQMSSVISS